MPHDCTNETAAIFERINAREVAMIQSGEANWYEVTIAQRTADGEVIGHEYTIVCARNAKAAQAGARGAAQVERKYGNPYATVAHVRRLAYRGPLHWEFSRSNRDAILAAGYYRA
jgi:Mg-chelatase subunit ChlI